MVYDHFLYSSIVFSERKEIREGAILQQLELGLKLLFSLQLARSAVMGLSNYFCRKCLLPLFILWHVRIIPIIILSLAPANYISAQLCEFKC